MKLTSDQASIVFVGSFNPRLFHPAWLQDHEVLTPKESAEALEQGSEIEQPSKREHPATVLITEDVAQLILGELQINVETNRLTITALTQGAHARSFEIASALLRLIPHSPSTSMGINRNFVIEEENHAYHKIGHTILPKQGFWAENGEQPGTSVVAVRYEKCGVKHAKLNLLVGPVLDSPKLLVRVNCNYHFDERVVRELIHDAQEVNKESVNQRLRLGDFEAVLTSEVWNTAIDNAFEIVNRVHSLGQANA